MAADPPDDDPEDLPDDIDQARAWLYAQPMESFVSERDPLVRRLRQAGRIDDAKAVRRCASRRGRRGRSTPGSAPTPDNVERLAAAVNEVIEAQAGRGDMRDATRSLRDAAQAVARSAGAAAKATGINVDRSSLVPAVLAVVADPVAFAELRQGQLAEIPAAGALDVLTSPPPLLPVSASAVAAALQRDVPEDAPPPPVDLASRRRPARR